MDNEDYEIPLIVTKSTKSSELVDSYCKSTKTP